MKKLTLIGLLLAGIAVSPLSAKMRKSDHGVLFPPAPGVYQTDTVYLSSCVCVSSQNFMIIPATRPAQLSHITISSVGATHGPAVWNLWDARTGTDTTKGAVKIGGPYPANVRDDWWYKTGVSSGIAITIERHGSDEHFPCFQIWHFEK